MRWPNSGESGSSSDTRVTMPTKIRSRFFFRRFFMVIVARTPLPS